MITTPTALLNHGMEWAKELETPAINGLSALTACPKHTHKIPWVDITFTTQTSNPDADAQSFHQ